MEKRFLISILALIQFVAVIQIGWAVFAPWIWKGGKSDQERVIREGGDAAVEMLRCSEEKSFRV